MGITRSTLIWIGVGVIIAICILLGIWALFLRGEESLLRDVSLGRGFGGDVPTFSGETGSTNELIRQGLERVGFSQENGASPAATGTTTATSAADTPAADLSFDTPRLWQLSSTPSAGITTIGASSTLRMRFVERPSGNVFDANPYNGDVTRVTNTLVPQTYRAHFPDDRRVILEHLDDSARRATFAATIEQSTSTDADGDIATLNGSYVDADITSLAAADQIFSMTRPGETAFGTLTDTLTQESGTRIFTSAAAHWRSIWLDTDTLLLVQHAANGVPGSALLLATDGTVTPLVRGVDGLTAVVHRDQSALLYSESAGEETTLYAQDGLQATPRALSIVTFAEKCVFDPQDALTAYCAVPQQLPDATLPDAWYRGEVHFSDVWWRIDLAENTSEFVLSPESEYGVALDVREPKVNAAGTHILFLDARTLTPWALRIAQ